MNISEELKEKIENTIYQAESKTDGEIIPVVIPWSDKYPVAHYRSGLTLGLLLTILSLILEWDSEGPLLVMIFFLVGFIAGFFLAHFSKVKNLFILPIERLEECTQRAKEIFMEYGITKIPNRNGVFIFLSLNEHYLEIIPDKGILEKVEETEWKRIHEMMLLELKRSELQKALITGISGCGALLEKHFPLQGERQNRFENKLKTP